MEKMKDLKDLLKHEVMDLYSAEEQIIEALPKMMEKATDPALKKALREHLNVTEKQKTRLDKVKSLLREKGEPAEDENKGFLSGLFGGGGHKCKGTQGLIEEGEKIMGEDMNPEVMDAAIIASAQKIEHYEICGYGTAKAFAKELGLTEVAGLLDQTLNEEYDADDLLTAMAVGRLNEEAEEADKTANRNRSRNGATRSNSNGMNNRSKTTASAPAKKSASSAKSSSTNRSTAKAAKKAALKRLLLKVVLQTEVVQKLLRKLPLKKLLLKAVRVKHLQKKVHQPLKKLQARAVQNEEGNSYYYKQPLSERAVFLCVIFSNNQIKMEDFVINVTQIEELQTIKDINALNRIFTKAKTTIVGGAAVRLIRKEYDGTSNQFDVLDTEEQLADYRKSVFKYLTS